MAIARTPAAEAAAGPQFRVNLNITLNGSKKMTHEEQEAGMEYESIRVLIYAGADEIPVTLVDERLSAKEFKTGSVGFGLQVAKAEFVSK